MEVEIYSETQTKIIVTCPFCGNVSTLIVPTDGFIAWQDGSLVQNAFPALSADEREILISGICEDCQSKFFV